MRFIHAFIAMTLWAIFLSAFGITAQNGANADTLIISLAIVAAGAMAGGTE